MKVLVVGSGGREHAVIRALSKNKSIDEIVCAPGNGGIASLAACGTSGVAGGSLLLIPMACSLFGIGNDIAMQAVAIGFIIGVVQDSVETAMNSSADVFFTATAEYYDQSKHS